MDSTSFTPGVISVNPNTKLIYVPGESTNEIMVIMDDTDVLITPTPDVDPIPTPSGKQFVFNCNSDLVKGNYGIERLVLELDSNESCILKLANLKPGALVEISTNMQPGRKLSIDVEPLKGMTDENGALEFTVSAIRKGIDWVAWAVKNDNGKFDFSKKAYKTGFAWGMFVEVR